MKHYFYLSLLITFPLCGYIGPRAAERALNLEYQKIVDGEHYKKLLNKQAENDFDAEKLRIHIVHQIQSFQNLFDLYEANISTTLQRQYAEFITGHRAMLARAKDRLGFFCHSSPTSFNAKS